MLLNLSLQNIKERKFRSILGIISIAIGVASIVVFLGLSNGIKTATFKEMEKGSPLTQITVHPNTNKSGVVSLLNTSGGNRLGKSAIENISKISGVKKVYPEIQFNEFASLEAGILGFSFITDSMLFGIPEEFLQNDIPECTNVPCAKWNVNSPPYPAIIPRKLLDMYNFALAIPQGLPLLNEKNLIGKKIMLYPKYSTFFPEASNKTDEIELQVVGFSDKVNLIGATLPYEFVQELNKKYASNSEDQYLELFVETESPDLTADIAKQIETLGYSANYLQKNLQEVEAKFKYLSISLGIISLIILISSTIAIMSTFLAVAMERKREIGLLRAVGATKLHIRMLILYEAGIIGIAGSILGIIIGKLGSIVFDHFAISQLSNTTFNPDSLFNITPSLIGIALIFGTLLSILSAYLPAKKASDINPFEALR